MTNLVLITSIIKTPNKPLSYTQTRSFYTPEERFEQTKKTIETIKEKIPDCKIFIVECSDLSENEHNYFIKNSDYFLNLINNESAKEDIYSYSKSLGEGTMTIYAIEYIIQNNIQFENFFKISGRYWLSDTFDYKKFDNKNCVIRCYCQNSGTFTALYKLPSLNVVENYKNFLLKKRNDMINCIGYEMLFYNFIKEFYSDNFILISPIGLSGYVSVTQNEFCIL